MLNMCINQPARTGKPGDVKTEVEFSGDLKSLLVELTYGISILYTRLSYGEPHGLVLASMFRTYLIQALTDPDSPCWNRTEEDFGGAGLTIVKK